ncbi:MAG: hypothetical protein ACTH0N_13785, partial [Brevibacterium aurantiacum]
MIEDTNMSDVSNTCEVSNAGEVDFERLPGVRFSALAHDIDSGERVFAHNENEELDTASMGKVFLLHTALQ